ncbi:MAG: tetratricopeptide repeat protein [Kiritimatiellia bacterium]
MALAAGCATPGRPGTRLALKSVPEVPASQVRADRAIVAAFFAANGARLDAAQLEQILPAALQTRHMDRNALRAAARANHRVLAVVKADELELGTWLERNRPLLVLLPPGLRYEPNVAAYVPVAWDRPSGTVELLDGNGEIRILPADEFFARREPLKHAALCLLKPGVLERMQPTREQKLVLADFWFDQGFYRRAQAAYTAIQEEAPLGTTDVEALAGQGNVLVRKKRYKEAIPVFRAALALEPDNPKILNNLAYCMLHGGGELLTALRHATKADRLDPENPLVLETLGSINLRVGDAPAAARYLERAWARALKRSPEIQIAIMDQLVRAWIAAGRRDLAWQVAEYRQRAFPDYRFPKDVLRTFPALRRPVEPLPENRSEKR